MTTAPAPPQAPPQAGDDDAREPLLRRLRRLMRPPRRLKFTRVGRYFTGMTLLVGFGAVDTGNNLLYLLLGMMLALIVISGVLSEQVIKGVEARLRLPDRLFARHPAPIEVAVTNPRARIPSLSIEIVQRILGVPADERPSAWFLRIDASATEANTFRYAFPRRGRVTIEGYEVVTHFPFGLFRKSREVDLPSAVVVFPALADPGAVSISAELPRGEVQRPEAGRGGDYYALRDYRHGDDIRDIHWKATARRDQTITREREKEEARRVTLCLANRWPQEPAGDTEDARAELEYAFEVCAGLAERLLSRGYVVALATLDGRISPGSGTGQLDRILRHLALAPLLGDPDAADAGGDDDAVPRRFEVGAGESSLLVGVAGELDGLSAGQVLARVPTRRPEPDAQPQEPS